MSCDGAQVRVRSLDAGIAPRPFRSPADVLCV